MRGEAPKLTERERYWLKHIRACEASGQRMSDYVAAHGLNVRALYDGKRTLVRKGVLPAPQPYRFQRVQIVDAVQGRGVDPFSWTPEYLDKGADTTRSSSDAVPYASRSTGGG